MDANGIYSAPQYIAHRMSVTLTAHTAAGDAAVQIELLPTNLAQQIKLASQKDSLTVQQQDYVYQSQDQLGPSRGTLKCNQPLGRESSKINPNQFGSFTAPELTYSPDWRQQPHPFIQGAYQSEPSFAFWPPGSMATLSQRRSRMDSRTRDNVARDSCGVVWPTGL